MTTRPDEVDAAALVVALHHAADVETRFDPAGRHLYATDASNYRHLPLGVVLPRTVDALVAAVVACRDRGVPVTLRGAGTSLAGQATNRTVIVDTSRHLTRILDLDPEAATARVEPGVVLADLQAAAAPHGLRFGPDPSTGNRATVGGMVGNDACGPHSVTAGRTSDNTVALDVATPDGTTLGLGWTPLEEVDRFAARPGPAGRLHAGLRDLRERGAGPIGDRFPTGLPRLVSGIHLDQLCLPGGMHTARALVGTEGTCAVVTGATLQLVEAPRATALAILAYPDDVAAAAAVPDLLAHGPAALEGIDARLADGARRVGAGRPVPGLDLLPGSRAWLIVETAAATGPAARAAADRLATDAGVPARIVADPAEQRAVWRVRAAGLGSITYAPGAPALLPGWEDAAVPPARLADYLTGLHDLLDDHGLDAGVYGHYGDGCVHTKIGFDHATRSGREGFRRFVEDAADLAVALGGSLSGEHGDGQARSELLVRMFGAEVAGLFRDFVGLWDPDGTLNPGRLVDPAPLDADLRGADRARRWVPDTVFAFRDHGGVVGAFDRCVGAGTCRRDDGAATMCPSYRATHDEQHSTRGRARLLGELLRPDRALAGFADPGLVEALELCLACKACAAECPVGVDLATLKAEAAHQRFDVEGGRRPRHAELLGRFRAISGGARPAPSLVNGLAATAAGRAVWRRLGLAPQRSLPAFAPSSFASSWRRRQRSLARGRTPAAGGPDPAACGPDPAARGPVPAAGCAPVSGGGATRRAPVSGGGATGRAAASHADVVLFVDTFTDRFAPQVAVAAVRALEAAGHAVDAVTDVCCGRPRYAEGMLDGARRDLDRLVDRLDATDGGAPVVWLEPSCLSVLRDERADLRPDPEATRVARRSVTLAEFVVARDWDLPRLDRAAAWHPHCHHRASLGTDADATVLDGLGLDWADLDAGCCGLAGAFGFVAGDRYAASIAIAQDRFAPRLRALPDATVTLMDGFSCREQARHLELPVRPRHLAEVLAAALGAWGTPGSAAG